MCFLDNELACWKLFLGAPFRNGPYCPGLQSLSPGALQAVFSVSFKQGDLLQRYLWAACLLNMALNECWIPRWRSFRKSRWAFLSSYITSRESSWECSNQETEDRGLGIAAAAFAAFESSSVQWSSRILQKGVWAEEELSRATLLLGTKSRICSKAGL